MIGQPAPSFQTRAVLNGELQDVENLHGAPALLLFFSIKCAGCTGRALPLSLDVAERYPDLQIVGIHSSFSEVSTPSLDAIQSVINYFDLPYPVIVDDGDATFRAYLAEGTPHWILLNADGTVRNSIFGSMAGAQQRLTYALLELFPSTE